VGILTTRSRLLWALVLVAASVFAVDLLVELGVAAAVGYVALIVLCLGSPRLEDTWIALGVGTVLILAGWALSPEGGVVWKVTMNRVLAFGALWAAGLGVLNKQAADEALKLSEEARAAAELELRDQQELARIGQMATMIAHEVKNPLAGISGAVTIIGRRLDPDAPEQNVIQSIKDRIHSLNESLQDLLVYARPPQLRRRSTPARSLLESTVSLLNADPEIAGLTVEIEAEPMHLDIDPQLIQQALMNLLLNAAHATDSTGRVTLRARLMPPMCCLEVVDDGPGVPADLIDRIFEPFVTSRARGTGLGLATVKRTVELHDGRVTIHCPPEGGTVVSMLLPASGGKAQTPAGASQRANEPACLADANSA
jgi:signal transduction histidine kinase